jgi:cytochrome oxidase Cu insertion factor (SCO1/SenC/PrrC family)
LRTLLPVNTAVGFAIAVVGLTAVNAAPLGVRQFPTMIRSATPLLTLLLGVLLASCKPDAPRRLSADAGLPETTAVSALKPGESVPEFAFANQDGRQLAFGALRPKAVLMTFIFTRCSTVEFCPRMSLKFQEARKVLDASQWKDAVELLSVTLDPEHDTPEALGAYSTSFDARPGSWTFAACAPDVLAALKSRFSVRATTGENGAIEHNLITVLVDSQGRLQKTWEGNNWSTEEILAELPRATKGGVAKNKSGY